MRFNAIQRSMLRAPSENELPHKALQTLHKEQHCALQTWVLAIPATLLGLVHSQLDGGLIVVGHSQVGSVPSIVGGRTKHGSVRHTGMLVGLILLRNLRRSDLRAVLTTRDTPLSLGNGDVPHCRSPREVLVWARGFHEHLEALGHHVLHPQVQPLARLLLQRWDNDQLTFKGLRKLNFAPVAAGNLSGANQEGDPFHRAVHSGRRSQPIQCLRGVPLVVAVRLIESQRCSVRGDLLDCRDYGVATIDCDHTSDDNRGLAKDLRELLGLRLVGDATLVLLAGRLELTLAGV
mmetsp:Transcript_6467/g.13938  ORF Transcript_6467/g.13938 Transcript_6467/m.13938 type:complete len:291 (-) Transcript_6467:622-1494(-)